VQAQNNLNDIEKEVDRASAVLSKSILVRYHEEQVWSDKIRRASTWGTWGLMGINIVLFIIVQLGLEPWKRRRLVNNFEEKVRDMLKEEKRQTVAIVESHIPDTNAVAELATAPEEALPSAKGNESEDVPVEQSVPSAQDVQESIMEDGKGLPEKISNGVYALFSDERISVRHVDMTTYVAGAFATGAVIVGTTLSLLWR